MGKAAACAAVLLGATVEARAETLTIATVNNSDMIIMQKLSPPCRAWSATPSRRDSPAKDRQMHSPPDKEQ